MSYKLRPTMISTLLFACLTWFLASCGTSTMPSSTSIPGGPHGTEVPTQENETEPTPNAEDDTPVDEEVDEEVVDENPAPENDETENNDDIPSDPVPEDTDNNDEEQDDTTEIPGGNTTAPEDTTPDEDTDEEPAQPQSGIVCTGDILIDSPDDMQYYENCTEIDGNLTIDCPDLFDFTFAYLTTIQGNLTVQNSNSLFTINGFDVLAYVGGSVDINNNPGMIYIEGLASLAHVNGDLIIADNSNLANLGGLDSLSTIAGSLRIERNMSLKNIDALSSVLSIGGDLNLSDNDILQTVAGLSSLSSIGVDAGGGSVIIYGNKVLKHLDILTNITQIRGDISISNNLELISTYGLRYLTHVAGNFAITNNPTLSRCDIDLLVGLIEAADGIDGVINRFGNAAIDDC